jgi:DNA polymerase V
MYLSPDIKTKAIRLPENPVPLELPLYDLRVSAGFPWPSDGFEESRLDLNEFLVKHKAASYFAWAGGSSMTGAGIFDGDLLLVDRAIKPRKNSVVIAVLGGGMVIKHIRFKENRVWLCPNPITDVYRPLQVTEDMDMRVWGVVTVSMHWHHDRPER